MACLTNARFVLYDSLVPIFVRRSRTLLHTVNSASLTPPLNNITLRPLRRRFTSTGDADSDSELFNYTSGRWIFNNALRHTERRRVFNVTELSRLAAESIGRRSDDIVSFKKLAEGGYNRTFLITMRDNFQLVARIPYPATVPKSYAVASEVATVDFLRLLGLPVPEIYGFSPTADNAAETEFIFMEFVDGTKLSDIWFDLEEREVESVMGQLVQLEAKMMSVAFPASGSIYYTQDLQKITGKPGISLKDQRFCIGPDVSLPLWFGRRSLLDVNRGPHESVESTLIAPANKELAYLQKFGQPLLPFRRIRREYYEYQEQPPSDHIDNLQRYLRIASSLIPKEPPLSQFCVRHPDLQESNVIVSRTAGSELRIVSLLDWQHTSVLPAFLIAGIPQRLQNYGDPISETMERPTLPENLSEAEEHDQSYVKERHRRRLVHYHYVKSTEECNEVHRAALADPMGVLRRRLFQHASDPWEGETVDLKVDLIEATQSWDKLTGGDTPCPITFDAEDIRKTMDLDAALTDAGWTMQHSQNIIGCGSEGWVPTEDYEEAMARCKGLKERVLAGDLSEKGRAEVEEHWPFDDMDEEKYT